MSDFHSFRMRRADGADCALSEYAGKVCLVVNVASRCGLTPQYEGLQRLQDRYEERGFTVLAFPCNQFMGQEPGSDAEIAAFCEREYGVTFPVFSKLEVNGDGRAPLYAWLCEQATRPDGPGKIQWNFAKFLIDRDGRVAARFAPQIEPEAADLRAAIEAALG